MDIQLDRIKCQTKLKLKLWVDMCTFIQYIYNVGKCLAEDLLYCVLETEKEKNEARDGEVFQGQLPETTINLQ